MSKNYIVYQSRNRETGTLCQTLDTKHADSDLKFDASLRYAARCVEHNKVVRFKEHYFAGRAIAHVSEWCKRCQNMIAKGVKVSDKKAMVSGAESARDGRPDLRMASNNNAHGKRWRNGATRRKPKSESQSNANQDGIYLGTDREKANV